MAIASKDITEENLKCMAKPGVWDWRSGIYGSLSVEGDDFDQLGKLGI